MRLLPAVLIALVSLPLDAGEPAEEATVTWYDVELIVFRNLDTRTSETWPTDAGVPDVEKARALFPPPVLGDTVEGGETQADVESQPYASASALDASPTPYVPLDESAYQLDGVLASLKRSSKYEPVLHVAWTQPPLEREQSPYIRITLPGALAPEETVDPDASEPLLGEDEATPALTGEVPGFLAEEESQPALARPLDGVVQLSVSRYLHFDIDLIYLPDDLNLNVLDDAPAATREWTEEETLEREQRRRALLDALARGDITLEEAEILALEPEEDVFQGFRLNQYRRVRSRELQYFDHPAYGAIVMVTPREVSARTLQNPVQSQ